MDTHNTEKSNVSFPALWTAETTTQWVDNQLSECKEYFQDTNEPSRVNFREWCAQWPWARRSDVYTHLLHRYPAKLLSYIPIFFLSSSYAQQDDIVLDPFAGSGTVLLESIIHPYQPRTCYGVEINPLARLVAKVKTTPLDSAHLKELARQLFSLIKSVKDDQAEIPDFPNRDFWFRKRAQLDLAKVRWGIERLDATDDYKDFFWVCFSAIIRDMSRADPMIAPPVKLKTSNFPSNRKEEIDRLVKQKLRAKALTLFRRTVRANIERMEELERTAPDTHAEIIWDDAKTIAHGSYSSKGSIDQSSAETIEGTIGLIITSPPYIAAQKYARTTKLEMWWLGLISNDDLASLDRRMIGTERVYFDEYAEFTAVGHAAVDQLLRRIFEINPERAGIASRYFQEMREALTAIHRVLRPNGICVLVIGNNTVCGYTIKNSDILAEMARDDCGFRLEYKLVDSIRSRGLITKRHETAGLIDDEWILVLRK